MYKCKPCLATTGVRTRRITESLRLRLRLLLPGEDATFRDQHAQAPQVAEREAGGANADVDNGPKVGLVRGRKDKQL